MSQQKETDVETLISPPVTSIPLNIFNIKCRFQKRELRAFDLTRCAFIFSVVLSIIHVSLIIMRESTIPVWRRWIPFCSTLTYCIMYGLKHVNLYMGGWGDSQGKFWCDVKIMYVRGFNTIRSFSMLIVSTSLFVFLCIALNMQNNIFYGIALIFLSEWQKGNAETHNQYDIKFRDKFTDDNGYLSLEALHCYQCQHKNEKTVWTPFVIHLIIKMYLVTGFFVLSNYSQPIMTLFVPCFVVIIFWSYINPIIMDFIYYKQYWTFCELELYRTVFDLVCVALVMVFTLV